MANVGQKENIGQIVDIFWAPHIGFGKNKKALSVVLYIRT